MMMNLTCFYDVLGDVVVVSMPIRENKAQEISSFVRVK
jgi:nitrogenase subunit NifH